MNSNCFLLHWFTTVLLLVPLFDTGTTLLQTVHAQVEFEKPANYTYDEPVVFNEWCQQMKDMYGPTCVCTTTIGNTNGIDALDLDHEIICDPLQGNKTCIDGVTVDTARVWLKASSIGEVGNYQNIQQTVILDFYSFLDDTSIGTTSFRYNANFNQRRSGCEAVFGGINCPRCGVCDMPPDNRTDDIHVHLSPADIFRGISGECRYGEGPPTVGLFNTCEDGGNVLTRLVWTDLEIKSPEESGACPEETSDAAPDGTADGGSSEASGASTIIIKKATMTFVVAMAAAVMMTQ